MDNHSPYFCILCTKGFADQVYVHLKYELVHFAIIFIEDPYDFVENAPGNTSIQTVDNDEELNTVLYNIRNDGFLSSKPTRFMHRDYTYAFFMRRIEYNTQKIWLVAENRIHKLIPKKYAYQYSYHTHDHEYKKYPVYSVGVNDSESNRILIRLNNIGYGDSLVTMPLLQKFCQEKKTRDFMIEIQHYYKASLELSEVFLCDCINTSCSFVDNLTPIDTLPKSNGYYKQVYDFDNCVIHSAFTQLQEMANFLGCKIERDLLHHVYVNDNYTPERCIKQIKALRNNYRYLIGVQFYTEHDLICSYKRNWDRGHIDQFIRICKKNEIGVVNLAPYSGDILPYSGDFSELSIKEIIGLYRYLDATVGIDSCCGHIAGVLRIPNLTLWGKILQDKSQMTLSMNYSIISETGDIDDIPPMFVYEQLIEVLNGKRTLVSHIQDHYAFDNNQNMIIYSSKYHGGV